MEMENDYRQFLIEKILSGLECIYWKTALEMLEKMSVNALEFLSQMES